MHSLGNWFDLIILLGGFVLFVASIKKGWPAIAVIGALLIFITAINLVVSINKYNDQQDAKQAAVAHQENAMAAVKATPPMALNVYHMPEGLAAAGHDADLIQHLIKQVTGHYASVRLKLTVKDHLEPDRSCLISMATGTDNYAAAKRLAFAVNSFVQRANCSISAPAM